MPETLAPAPLSLIGSAPPESAEAQHGRIAANRQALVDSMVSHGLISETFSRSGALEAFSVDEALGRDALSHILVGDTYGGGHHLPTMVGLDMEGRQVASIVANPNNPEKKRDKYRHAQKVKANGVYEARIVNITDSSGQVFRKDFGSAFFPNGWTTQEVIESIIEASQKPGEHNPDRRVYTHIAIVRGVKVVVNTDDLTGKIVAARPGRS